MDTTSLLWLAAIVVIAVAAGVGIWLAADMQAGRKRAESSRRAERRVPPPPSRDAPSVEPKVPPPAPDPRIRFGETRDLYTAQPATPEPPPTAVPGQNTTGQSRTCPVCRHEIAIDQYLADRVVICPDCRTHVHSECWEYSSNQCPNCGQV